MIVLASWTLATWKCHPWTSPDEECVTLPLVLTVSLVPPVTLVPVVPLLLMVMVLLMVVVMLVLLSAAKVAKVEKAETGVW